MSPRIDDDDDNDNAYFYFNTLYLTPKEHKIHQQIVNILYVCVFGVNMTLQY